ncbi:MAG: hypothetical protein IGS49_14630 [Chlorogloeopsis fritschii C42_A2020_084]|jgi:uncharacterized coiled-coil DUF342 family protein|uniref:hypothetical protein n=1 Tax=Chlorogloeopsis fritschii TaxID=1124 RepID=UPI0019EDF89A|nr:hypothetical protein [Chlorogloeopsis fritschii]MBF2006661.1 hypothetical protein [Chlorogloeopsis fritschii C42_A2020_084]
MVNYVPTFLGSVQKAIACTPNNNPNTEAYTQEVLPAARKIRQLAEELGKNQPSTEQMKEAISLLVKIFEVKQVDMEERRERLEEILNLHQLQNTFPEIMSSFKEPILI